jgi:hypothetical protein
MARQRTGGRHGGTAALVATVAGMLIALAFADGALAAEGPRWAITAVPTPTNLVPESPRSEIDRLTVDATGGTYRLEVGSTTTTASTGPLAYNASAAEVEAALDTAIQAETPGYAVSVSGGPGGSAPYTIEWTGEAAKQSLFKLGVKYLRAESKQLTGASHTATVTTVTKGVSPAQLLITATNISDVPTNGGAVTVSDVLPPGMTTTAVKAEDNYKDWEEISGGMTCTTSPLSCSYKGTVDPGDSIVMTVTLEVQAGLPGFVENETTASGGGSTAATAKASLPVNEGMAPFGVAAGSVVVGFSSNQAGAHADVTTSFTLNTSEPGVDSATPKDVRFDLPRGLVGNTVGMPRCSMHGVIEETQIGPKACPADAMVGAAVVTLHAFGTTIRLVVPVYNIAPAPGEPAAFGFDALIVPARLDTGVLSNGDYGVRVTAPDINEGAAVIGTTVTIWGVPSDHNGPGPDSTLFDLFFGGSFGGPGTGARVPLLTNPQQCSEPLSATMSSDSWVDAGNFVSSGMVSLGTLTGCNQLRLASSFSMVPDTLEAGAPAGYHFDLRVPQNEAPDGLATPNVKNVTLKLPVGTVVNPSAAWGLKACSDSQFYGPGHPSQAPAGFAACPREAQVGTVEIKTPALEEALEGQVYLAEPECDPCTPEDAEDGRMVRLFVQAFSEGEGGIVVKLEGHGKIDQATGQITTSFKDNPQLPFDEFKLKLSGGPRAVLANPRACGPATSMMDLTPWSTPFTPDITPSYTFDINGNCFGPQFNPSFVAGSPNIQSGAYSPFTLSFGRSDNDEFLSGIKQTMPPGLLGNLSNVPLCKEPEAAQGTCGSGSVIGHVQVLTGPGADPFLVSGGQVSLTEGYGGAPYGLSIVVPAVAGPYTLSGTTGKGTVVVRAKIVVDPITAALTVTSDPLPTVLDGIPLQLKAVNVTIDKPDFTFNPTSCAKMAIGGVLSSAEGMTATKSSSFQVTNCASLVFKPGFHASTSGNTSRANGASLDVKLTYPTGSFGKDANIRSVKVDLPKKLPSRLTTLQKACPAATFEANPAACPAASRVGTATATTPIIPVALTGPAYFVSYGGAKFPELVIVLSGYGVTVQLHGETFINKAGITSSTFRSIPDVPVQSFELKLPQGPNSALAANGNLCTSTLKMPTAFTAQNGMVIHQNTPITATGCPKRALTRAQKLARALKACRKDRSKAKRAKCEKAAHRRYGAKAKKKGKKKK